MDDFPNISSRLDHILEACGYPTKTAFTEALKVAKQQWANWAKRNSVGNNDVRIHELTGVSLTWLKTGRGNPFPNGPIKYIDPADLYASQDELDNLAAAVATVVECLMKAKAPGTENLKSRLRDVLSSAQSRSPVVEAVLAAVEIGGRAREAAGSLPHVAETPGPYASLGDKRK